MPTGVAKLTPVLQYLWGGLKKAFGLLRSRWLLALSLVLGLIVLAEALRKTVVIDAISVPKQLDDAGYKPDVISAEIRDKSTEIEGAIIGTQAHTDNLNVREAELPDIEVPTTKLSIRSIIQLVQFLTGYESLHLSGELICLRPDCSATDKDVEKARRFDVISRVTDGSKTVHRKRFQARDVDDAVEQLSEELLSQVNPYLLGRYVNEIKIDPVRASSIFQSGADSPRYRYRAFAYNGLANIQVNQKGRVGEAVNNYRKAIELERKRAPLCSLPAWLARYVCPADYSFLHCNLGRALVQQGNVTEANKAYSKAKSLGPDSAYLHGLSGDIFEAEARLDEAVSEYQTAIAMGLRGDPHVYYQLGRILWLKGNFDQASENFRKASDIDPKHKEHIEALTSGRDLWLKGDFNQALEKFRKASDIDPRLKEQIQVVTSKKPDLPSPKK